MVGPVWRHWPSNDKRRREANGSECSRWTGAWSVNRGVNRRIYLALDAGVAAGRDDRPHGVAPFRPPAPQPLFPPCSGEGGKTLERDHPWTTCIFSVSRARHGGWRSVRARDPARGRNCRRRMSVHDQGRGCGSGWGAGFWLGGGGTGAARWIREYRDGHDDKRGLAPSLMERGQPSNLSKGRRSGPMVFLCSMV